MIMQDLSQMYYVTDTICVNWQVINIYMGYNVILYIYIYAPICYMNEIKLSPIILLTYLFLW